MNLLSLGPAILTLLALPFGRALECEKTGAWSNCNTFTVAEGASYADCLKKCNDLPDTDCTHFTFSTSAKKDSCLLHTGCKEINPNLCKACISGERLCRTPGLVCKEKLWCKEEPSEYLQDIKSADDCFDKCSNSADASCKFYTYFSSSETCLHFKDHCHDLDVCTDCESGDIDCIPICNGNFCCSEGKLATFEHSELKLCYNQCVAHMPTGDCKWYSLDLDTNTCSLYAKCDDRTDQNCITGESRCPAPTPELNKF